MDDKCVSLLYASHHFVEGLKKAASDARQIAEREGVFGPEDLTLLDARWLIEKHKAFWFPSANAEKYVEDFCPDISLFSPDEFERLVQVILFVIDQRHFCLTPASHDGGVDLTCSELISSTWDAYHHIVVQCKLYRGYVPTSEIRDFFGVMTSRTATGIFVTTGEITSGGREFIMSANSSPHSNRYYVVSGAHFGQLLEVCEKIVANIEATVDASDDEQEELRLAEQNAALQTQGREVLYRREAQSCQLELF